MNLNRLIALHAAILITLAAPALTQDDRSAIVQKIADARGLTEVFDGQMVQQRDATKAYAAQVFGETIAAAGGKMNPREQAAFDKMVLRTSEMFKGSEIAAVWIAQYGRDLSVPELQQILSYYESPIGRRDVAASKAAITTLLS